jgi:hypothetical protein
VVRRQRFKVVGSLSGRCAIHGATSIEDVLEMGGLWDVLRTLKHHVFEQVRKSGSAMSLISRTHIVVDGH